MTDRASGLRVELGRLAALVGVAGVAIAQPVLDVFGKSPETFIFRGAEGIDLVLFSIVIVLVPPLVVWWVGVVIGFFTPRWRVLVHGASIGALAGLAAVQVASGLARLVALALAAVVAVGAWVLTVRSGTFRLWSEFLAVLPVFALVAFLVASPASDVVTGADFAAAASSGGRVAPVVLIVLDELPTASIVDADGAIDAVRFPNLARLAGRSTWYRNHTTQSGFTETAVPAIFTGRRPEQVAPLFTQHPDNIFRLLAGSHDLVVSEALTRLCPTSVCGEAPQAPAATGDAGSSEARTGRGPAMGQLWGDAVGVWTDRISGSAPAARFDEFEEEAADAETTPDASFGAGEVPVEQGLWEEAVASQPTRLTDFLAALQPGDRPLAAVLHLVSPHFPWHYLPDGRTYAEPARAADLPINGGGDPWVGALERQRHLLQAAYTDRLVGQVLQRLDEIGIYDEAAVVVTADHGVAFSADPNRRLPVPDALPEIMWSPLIVKAPGQTDARVDDANVQSIDVLPTIAALIGVDIPWAVDGVDVNGDGPAARGTTKPFRRFETGADPYPSSDLDVDGAEGFTTMLGLAFPPVGPDDDPSRALYELSGRGELVGQAYEPTRDLAGGTIGVDDRDRLLDSRDPVLVLTGTVDGGAPGSDYVVAAVEGRVVAVSPVVERANGGPAFALLLPTDGAVTLREVRLGLVRGDDVLDAGAIGG